MRLGSGSDRGGSKRRRRALASAAAGTALLIAVWALPGRAAHPLPAHRSDVAAELSRIDALAERRLSRPAGRLAKVLPGEASRFRELREPAATVEAQLGIALDELRAMSALRWDPHYLPALLAVGRAYVAATGRDPVTGTAPDPGYTGLRRELGTGVGRLRRDAGSARRLARAARRLRAMLRGAQRRARRLERRAKRSSAGPAPARGR